MIATIQTSVLIVEDDAGIAELERYRLDEAGYSTFIAADTDEAIRLVAENDIDLILLDYRLPGNEDGLQFFERIRAAGHDIPVILVTGFSNEATVIRALRAGVRDFVTKSMEYLDYLPEAVGRVLHQVNTEHKLLESQARLGQIIAAVSDAIIVTDDEHRITLFNPAAEKMFHCGADDAVGRSLESFIPDVPSDARSAKDSDGLIQAGASARGIRGDGSEFPIEASMSRGEAGGRGFHAVVVRDITERRRAEERHRAQDAELAQARRMESVGLLASGVAHDFNNLLTVISGYCELLLSKQSTNAEARPLLREIFKAGESAASLTRQLLAFGRKQMLAPRALNVNDLVGDLEKMLRRLIGADIDLKKSLDPGLGKVQADPGQIEQVILNLVVNARDAMPTGGRITIETRSVELDGSFANMRADFKPGPYVMLAVADTGCGMDEATRTRIFEPFFTTKEVGKGTGLGLATVHGIVKQSGGHIEVDSEAGLGSKFKIYLPRTESMEVAAPAPAATQVIGGNETILVVEDQELVRGLSRVALVSNGYHVLEAADGEKALQVAAEYAKPIDLLVTDLVMPCVNGRDLAEQLGRAQSSLKVLFTSGYTDDAVIRHGVVRDGVAFLQKPFTPTTLAKKVREVLDQR